MGRKENGLKHLVDLVGLMLIEESAKLWVVPGESL
jgi:hypothetical protein